MKRLVKITLGLGLLVIVLIMVNNLGKESEKFNFEDNKESVTYVENTSASEEVEELKRIEEELDVSQEKLLKRSLFLLSLTTIITGLLVCIPIVCEFFDTFGILENITDVLDKFKNRKKNKGINLKKE